MTARPPFGPISHGPDLTDAELLQRCLCVDVCHLNIGTGDSAVYFLVEYPTAQQRTVNPAWTRPYIHRSALIDGGLRSGAADITDFLVNRVYGIYDFNTAQGGRTGLLFPPFDSILITHWDSDHCDGVIELLWGNLVKGYEKTPETPPTSRADFLTQYLSPYCKYSAPATGETARADRAITYLYVPYWGEQQNPPRKFPTDMGAAIGSFWPNTDDLNPKPDEFGPDITDMFLDWNADRAPPTSARVEATWAKKFCKIRAGTDALLGRSLFTNWAPPTADYPLFKNPMALALAHRNQAVYPGVGNCNALQAEFSLAANPFLMIVGANSTCVGQSATGRETQAVEQKKLLDSYSDFTMVSADAEPDAEIDHEELAAADTVDNFITWPEPKSPTSEGSGGDMNAEPTGDSDDDTEVELIKGSGDDMKVGNRPNNPPSGSSGNITQVHNTAPPIQPSGSSTDTHNAESDNLDKMAHFVKPLPRPPPAFHGRGSRKIINEPLTQAPAKQANAVSVITLVVWTDGHISHYAAGDSNWENELKVLAWIQFGQNPYQCVRTMKLSHHGAADSTPIPLIRGFRPRSITVSAATTSHGHPRYELLLWLHLWVQSTRRVIIDTGIDLSTGIVNPTGYPYYLAYDSTLASFAQMSSNLSINALSTTMATTSDFVDYRASLRQLSAVIRRADLNYVDNYLAKEIEFAALSKSARDGELAAWVYDVTFKAWPVLSRALPAVHPLRTGKTDPNASLIPATKEIQYIHVACRSVSAARRAAEDRSKDSMTLLMLQDLTNKQAAALKAKAAKSARLGGGKKRLTDAQQKKKAALETQKLAATGVGTRRAKAARDALVEAARASSGSAPLSTPPPLMATTTVIVHARKKQRKGPYDRMVVHASTKMQANTEGTSITNSVRPAKRTLGEGIVSSIKPSVDNGLSAPTNTTKSRGDIASATAALPSALNPAITATSSAAKPPDIINLAISETSAGPFDIVPLDLVSLYSHDNPVLTLKPASDYEALTLFMRYSSFTVKSDGQLTDDDEFRDWLVSALDADTPSATVKLDSLSFQGPLSNMQVIDVTGMEVSLPVSTRAPQAMTFSTGALTGNFSWNADTYNIPTSGIFPLHMMLVLGLVESAPGINNSWSFAQVLIFLDLLSQDLGDTLTEFSELFNLTDSFVLQKGSIWFMPDENYRTVQRLAWTLGPVEVTTIKTWLARWTPLSIQNPTVVGRKNRLYAATAYGYEIKKKSEILLSMQVVRSETSIMTASLDFDLDAGGNTITVTLLPSDGSLSDLLGWILTLFGTNDDQSGILDIVNHIPGVHTVKVRRIQLILSKLSVDKFTFDLEVTPGWTDVDGTDIVLLLTYIWQSGKAQPHSLIAQVWFDADIFTSPYAQPPQFTPTYEDVLSVRPSIAAATEIHLKSMMPGNYSLPSELDLSITQLLLSIEDRTISFTGTLQASSDADSNLGISLEEVSLQASYTFSGPKAPDGGPNPTTTDSSSYSLSLFAEIDLQPQVFNAEIEEPDETVITATVDLRSENNKKYCHLRGEVDNLSLGLLGGFFPAEDAKIVTDLLGHLNINSLVIDYTYDTAGKASDFSIAAVITIDIVELDLTFKRDQVGWTFNAKVQAASGVKITVGTLMQALLNGDDLVSKMPDFITGINLGEGAANIELNLTSVLPPAPVPPATAPTSLSSYLVVGLSLHLPGPDGLAFEFDFLQITDKAAAAQSSPTTSLTKRLIKANVSSLPWSQLPNPPIVGKIEPPFDQLSFYWVQDPLNSQGLTRAEVSRMSTVSDIQFMETIDPKNQKDTDVVVPAGMHFLISDSAGTGATKILLDYLFNKPAIKVVANGSAVEHRVNSLPHAVILADTKDDGVPPNTPDGTGTATGKLEKTVGPLQVSNVGIRFEDNQLILYLDVTVHLGPIGVALIGLGMGINLTGVKLNDLSTLHPSLHLAGMGVEFNQPPVGFAGMFVDKSTKTQTMYVGGISLTIMPYSFLAVGAYGEIQKPEGGSFKTVFIFAKLNGPLIELEFVTIGGITLGFGYNSSVRFPSITQVPDFPFIANSAGGADDDPLSTMTKLTSTDPNQGWVSPTDGSFWLAAGLEAKALQVLDVSAVVIIEFNPYVSFGIFAKCIAQMPPQPTPYEACFIYVELGLMAAVDLHAGSMVIAAQLSPNSFVIAPSCHLTGGFALCYWFGASPYAGDFVFTVGGYHAAFKPPSHYPVVPRLGISWDVGGGLSIMGGAYFAITPHACMGGGMLNAVFTMGLLSAYFNAYADFLMNYSPFHFVGDMGVSVGVHFTLDLLFVTIHINVDISANVHLAGPPFGGVAHVDFWVFGFDVPFGESPTKPQPISLFQLKDLLIQVPDSDSSVAAGTQAGTVDKLHILSVQSGRYAAKAKSTETKQSETWEVKRGDFIFGVQTRIPLQAISEVGFSDADALATSPGTPPTPFYSKPMQITSQLISTMTVTIMLEEKGGTTEIPVHEFKTTGIIKSVPKALWAVYDANNEPGSGNNNVPDLLTQNTPGTLDLLMGANFAAPPPFHSFDKIVRFPALKANSADVFTEEDHFTPTLPSSITSARGDWNASQPVDPTKDDPAKQWEAVVENWKSPVLNPAPEAGGLPKDDASSIPVVKSVIAAWSGAFGWDYSTDEDTAKGTNQLSSETPDLLWGQFEQLYMAAPLISVS